MVKKAQRLLLRRRYTRAQILAVLEPQEDKQTAQLLGPELERRPSKFGHKAAKAFHTLVAQRRPGHVDVCNVAINFGCPSGLKKDGRRGADVTLCAQPLGTLVSRIHAAIKSMVREMRKQGAI